MSNRSDQRLPAAPPLAGGRVRRLMRVYDCRSEQRRQAAEKHISGSDFTDFLRHLKQNFSVGNDEKFFLTTTDRTVLDYKKFEELPDGSTLLLLQRLDQALPAATREQIKFVPHFKTLTEGGLYEYYASKGESPLPYALAELIDNAISATAKNTGVRTVEIRMMFDETLGKPAIIVLDNGCGMSSKQLNNWAVYRLSKFSRENSNFASEQEGYVRPAPVSRSLNSDVSYFGVGGKQAVFFIGDSVRMISKPRGSPDVHELILSKEDFENKERNKEDIYRTDILSRKPGDFSHVVKAEERFLEGLIQEETRKESFTAVVITGVRLEHIPYLKTEFKVLTRQLAHVYHYYVHGVNGNNLSSGPSNSDHPTKVDIQVTFREKPPKIPTAVNLKEVEDDMQTLYITSAADSFEFKAFIQSEDATVEGILRYHPFLFDRETYPQPPVDEHDSTGDYNQGNDDDESGVGHVARGKQSIFECYWNGRLIPQDTGFEFEWCTRPKQAKLPPEVYSRFSGVLFTDDKFKVTTNKRTFVNLEGLLKKRDTIFTRVKAQRQRADIKKEFTQWLEKCHKEHDKQIKFIGFKKTITREDVPTKSKQHPWETFSSIQWDQKNYKTGQLVRTQKTVPIMNGTVVQFLLFGKTYKTNGSVFATGGEVELALEPKPLYDKTKIIPISKIDKNATDEFIRSQVQMDLARLPHKLSVAWPENNPWPQNAVRPAGTALGPIQVQILNMDQISMNTLPSVDRSHGKKMIIRLKIVHQGGREVACYDAHHTTKWDYYFKKNETLTQLGKYTLSLNAALNEHNTTVIGGMELPSYKLNFTIKAGSAHRFLIEELRSPLQVGVPVNIPLNFKDAHGHQTSPPTGVQPVIECSGLELSFEKADISGNALIIRGVKARGKCQHLTQDLKVTVPGLIEDTQSLKFNLRPGYPHSLHVTTENNPVENGNPLRFRVEVHDEAGNLTTNQKQNVRCEVTGLPPAFADCSTTGTGLLITRPVNLKLINGEPQMLKAKFTMPGRSNIEPVEREVNVLPSTRVTEMTIYCSDGDNLVFRNKDMIEWPAGGLLSNLVFKLFDEAGREVALSEEIASRIKVNWTADVNLQDLVQGKLPDVQVSTKVHEKRFYQVSYQDQSVSVSFYIVPRPNEPARLRAILPQSTVKLGETLPTDIILDLVDQYDNATKTLTADCVEHMTVEADGLDQSAIVFTWQESEKHLLVKGIQFQSGSPGAREMCFTYKGLEHQAIIKVMPGVPVELKLISGPEQPLQVLNDHGISTPFLVQLCDRWGNPSQDQRVVVELKSSPQTLKVTTAVTSQPVDAEGKASFTVTRLSGTKGYYTLVFQCSFNENPIPGPSVNITLIPDRNKPVSLSVKYSMSARFPAGGKFPVFSVTVLSEEGSPITSFNPAAVSMLQWSGEDSGTRPPQTATVLRCSKPLENEETNCFHFRDKDIPQQAGTYTIQFCLKIDQERDLLSRQIPIIVEPNPPVKLGLNSNPPTPVVSCSSDISNRTLVENLTLIIMDKYGNPAGQSLSGKVVVSIKNSDDDRRRSLPLFEGRTSSCDFSLVKGTANIPRLAIMENSPGESGISYVLLFKPEVPIVLDPFELQFQFCNDVERQVNMSLLAKKRQELCVAVDQYKGLFKTHDLALPMLKSTFEDASKREQVLRNSLISSNIIIAQNVSLPNITTLVAEKTAEAESIKKQLRVCSISDQFRGQDDVLGKVGLLALVQDEQAAWVISWQIRGDMDCVITRTTEAAQKIYKDTGGSQEVMPLDSVPVQRGDRPLPHIKNGRPLFNPPGNPIYARSLLIFPNDPQSCEIVFKNILGDTIIINDMDSGNSYRRSVVQNGMHCPTILTRNGERISARGKFGGLNNRAPSRNTIPMLGSPFPPQYHQLRKQIDMLHQYHSAVEKRDKAAKDYGDHQQKMRSSETLKRQEDMERKMRQIEEIDRQLASAAVRPLRRAPGGAEEPSGIAAKRARPT